MKHLKGDKTKTEFIITISVILGVTVLLVLLKLVFSSVRKKLQVHIQERFAGIEIIGATTEADFLGKLSKGGWQIRGNGGLVLTKNGVFFLRSIPFREYMIPIKSITDVSMPNSFNGKSIFSKLLCVQYKVDSGTETMAWVVKNPEKWKKAIEKLMTIDH